MKFTHLIKLITGLVLIGYSMVATYRAIILGELPPTGWQSLLYSIPVVFGLFCWFVLSIIVGLGVGWLLGYCIIDAGED